MLKIKIAVDGASFEFDGEAPFTDVRPLIEQWFTALLQSGHHTQAQIDALAARVGRSSNALQSAVDAAHP